MEESRILRLPLPSSKVKEVETQTTALKRVIAEKKNAAKDAEERLKELAKKAEVDARRLEDLHKEM